MTAPAHPRRVPERDGQGRYEEHGSRFLAQAFRVADAGGFAARLAAARAAHPKARHHCWAYRLAPEYRFSDDGEPGGSAGRPLYTLIEGAGLTECALIVVRYFGGVKLGVGGLVRAYTVAGQAALAAAGVRLLAPQVQLALHLPYEALGLRDVLAGLLPGAQWSEPSYGDAGAGYEVLLPEAQRAAAEQLLAEHGGGRACWRWHNPRP